MPKGTMIKTNATFSEDAQVRVSGTALKEL
jgi:hypothetical protein